MNVLLCFVIWLALLSPANCFRMAQSDAQRSRTLQEEPCFVDLDKSKRCYRYSQLITSLEPSTVDRLTLYIDQLYAGIEPPVTAKQPTLLQGIQPRNDSYYWLRDDNRTDPDVLAHLAAENSYAASVLAPLSSVQDSLVQEMLDRLPRHEESTPQRYKSHYYYTVHRKRKNYRQYCRRPFPGGINATYTEYDSLDTTLPEQILLDEDELANGTTYFDLTGFVVSPNEALISYGIDTDGSERYTLYIKTIHTDKVILDGAALGDPFTSYTGEMVFLSDTSTILFTTLTNDTHRPHKVYAYSLLPEYMGREPTLIHEEPDESFHLALWSSRTEKHIFLQGQSEVTHYYMYMPHDSIVEFTPLAPKMHEMQYTVRDDGNGSIYAIVSSAEERNGKLIMTALKANALDMTKINTTAEWTVLQPHNRDVELTSITLSSTHLVVFERSNGTVVATAYKLPLTTTTSLISTNNKQSFTFDDASYSLALGDQGSYNSSILRVQYTSLTQPDATYDINMNTGNRVLKGEIMVLGYDSSLYHSQLLWAESYDGVRVPISMVYRRDRVKLDGSDALLLEAYGAYAVANDPEFSGTRLSLLDRGFIYCIAHVRGGGELGQYWYQDGKLLNKINTFKDVETVAEFLIEHRYTSNKTLCIWGRSAGGLTVGVAVNQRPDLFAAAVLDVPFVDIVSTMSDPDLPLTVIEYEEWGNPTTNATFFQYMMEYSPVDNVQAQDYPTMLVTAGLNDPRVQYWEPAKLVAKIREYSTAGRDNPTLLVVNMGAGHFAHSGLEDRLAETAMKYAFLLEITKPCSNHSSSSSPGGGGGFQPGSTNNDETCENCFAMFGLVMSAVALVTLGIVLRPRARPSTEGGSVSATVQRRLTAAAAGISNSSAAHTESGGGSRWSFQPLRNLLMGNKRYSHLESVSSNNGSVQMSALR